MASMFEFLSDLPLFQGASHNKLAEVVGNTKLHFLKYPAEEIIIRAGDSCQHLAIVIQGSVRATTVNETGRFSVSQTLAAPAVLAPDFLFGRVTAYPYTVMALDNVSIIKIAKNDYLNILETDRVFLFNYLNTLSANAQKSVEGILALTTGDVDERIAFWIGALTQPGSTDIRLTCRTRDLCSLFGTPRALFNAALQSMRERGLIDFTSNELMVVDRTALMQLLMTNHEAIPALAPTHPDIIA